MTAQRSSQGVADPTVACGAWDGARLVTDDAGLAAAFADHDLEQLPAELWAAASLPVCRRLAAGTAWEALGWRERRTVTVAVTRAVAQIVLDAFAATTGRHVYATGAPAGPLPDLDVFTAVLVANGNHDHRVMITAAVDAHGTVSFPTGSDPVPVTLAAMIAAGQSAWEPSWMMHVADRPGACPELELYGGVSVTDPTVAWLTVRPNVAWLTEVWATGRTAHEGRIVTRLDGPTAIATRVVFNSLWTGYRPHRIQVSERDPAWVSWPPGAERHLEVTDAVWAQLLAGDLEAAIVTAARWGDDTEGTPFRGPANVEAFADYLRVCWDDPGLAEPPVPDLQWPVVRAIDGWHRVAAPWGLATFRYAGQLIADGVSPLAARAYALVASVMDPTLRTAHDLRVLALLSPATLAVTCAELVDRGLFIGADGPLPARARLAPAAVLKDAARAHGVKASGTKRDLIDRLGAFPETLEDVAGRAWHDAFADGAGPGDEAWIVVAAKEAHIRGDTSG